MTYRVSVSKVNKFQKKNNTINIMNLGVGVGHVDDGGAEDPRLSNCLVQICCTPRSNSGFYNISCDDDACLLCLELSLMAA